MFTVAIQVRYEPAHLYHLKKLDPQFCCCPKMNKFCVYVEHKHIFNLYVFVCEVFA